MNVAVSLTPGLAQWRERELRVSSLVLDIPTSAKKLCGKGARDSVLSTDVLLGSSTNPENPYLYKRNIAR